VTTQVSESAKANVGRWLTEQTAAGKCNLKEKYPEIGLLGEIDRFTIEVLHMSKVDRAMAHRLADSTKAP
jgi:hypothetical protein